MTFQAAETSQDGLFSPEELYLFTYQGTSYSYTSGQEIRSYNGNDYLPQHIKRGGLNTATTEEGDELEIEVKRDNPLALFYKDRIPLDTVTIVIYRFHRNDPDDEKVVWYTGVVKNVIWKNSEIANLITNAVTNFLDRFILRGTHQVKCNHTIYDEHCQLQRAVYELPATVLAVEDKGLTITFSALPTFPGGSGGTEAYTGFLHDRPLVGGVLRLGTEFATIIGQANDTDFELALLVPLTILVAGDVVYLAPGCQGEYWNCRKSFTVTGGEVKNGNAANYLGFRDVPLKNPVGNSAMWGDG